jgi:hypothetical protein
MSERPTPKRLAAIRHRLAIESRWPEHERSHMASDAMDLARELDAVTRERDEARKDSARLDWMQAQEAYVNVGDDEVASCYVQSNRDYQLSGYAPEYDVRGAIDAAMSSDSAASNEGAKPEAGGRR